MIYAVLLTGIFSAHNMSAKITNEFFPLSPGVRMTYKGTEDGRPAREEVEVLPSTTTVAGAPVTTVRDSLYVDGRLAERTDDWYAQDRAGNVWYLGEDSKAYKKGHLVSTVGSWQAGENGARAGIMMLAHPHVGDRYHQEYAVKTAQDEANVTRLNWDVSVTYGRFRATVCTQESSALEPAARDYKCYAKGVGLVRAYSDTTDLRLQTRRSR